MIKSAMHKIFS